MSLTDMRDTGRHRNSSNGRGNTPWADRHWEDVGSSFTAAVVWDPMASVRIPHMACRPALNTSPGKKARRPSCGFCRALLEGRMQNNWLGATLRSWSLSVGRAGKYIPSVYCCKATAAGSVAGVVSFPVLVQAADRCGEIVPWKGLAITELCRYTLAYVLFNPYWSRSSGKLQWVRPVCPSSLSPLQSSFHRSRRGLAVPSPWLAPESGRPHDDALSALINIDCEPAIGSTAWQLFLSPIPAGPDGCDRVGDRRVCVNDSWPATPPPSTNTSPPPPPPSPSLPVCPSHPGCWVCGICWQRLTSSVAFCSQYIEIGGVGGGGIGRTEIRGNTKPSEPPTPTPPPSIPLSPLHPGTHTTGQAWHRLCASGKTTVAGYSRPHFAAKVMWRRWMNDTRNNAETETPTHKKTTHAIGIRGPGVKEWLSVRAKSRKKKQKRERSRLINKCMDDGLPLSDGRDMNKSITDWLIFLMAGVGAVYIEAVGPRGGKNIKLTSLKSQIAYQYRLIWLTEKWLPRGNANRPKGQRDAQATPPAIMFAFSHMPRPSCSRCVSGKQRQIANIGILTGRK